MLLTSSSSLPEFPNKIISLVPSLTELLFHLGLEKEVAGITKFCIHPRTWYKNKQRIGGTKTVNINMVRNLQPDLIIANKEENVKAQVEMLADEFAVWLTDISNLDDACNMINNIGELTNKVNGAQTLVNDIRNEFLTIEAPLLPIKACYLVWRDPYMTVGVDTFINDMMQHCGLQNIFRDQSRYPEITLEEIKDRACNLVILPNEPYPFRGDHAHEIQQLLPGVKVILADGEMFSWYGSHLLHAPSYFTSLLKQQGL